MSYFQKRWFLNHLMGSFLRKNRNGPKNGQNGQKWIQCSPMQVPFRAIGESIEENKKWRTGHFKAIYTLMRFFTHFWPFRPFFGPFLFFFLKKIPSDDLKINPFGNRIPKLWQKNWIGGGTFFWTWAHLKGRVSFFHFSQCQLHKILIQYYHCHYIGNAIIIIIVWKL